MNTKYFGITSIGLWMVTFFLLGYFFLFGNTTKTVDKRTVIHLTEDERNLVFTEMRALLAAVNGIVSGLADKDYERAAKEADAVGMGLVASLEHQEKTILLKLPVEFKKLGFGTHEKFDELAKSIRKKEDIHILLKEIDLLTQNCVACHASYQIGKETK
ncbi:MAG: hypothetical protein KBF93_22635 [Leptospiraceae bacterium]|nr:hypothetical protein [Leptospiraceae bacterium]